MKRTLTLIAVLIAFIGFSQIRTQTLNTTTSVSATNQTITTYTVLTTNTVLNNDNLFSFALTWNMFTPATNTMTGVLRLNINNMAPNADWFKLSKNLSTNAFDSLRITLDLASTDPTNTLAIDGTTLVSTITTSTPQYQNHSARVINTNTTVTSYSLVLTGGLTPGSYMFLKDLTVKSYSTHIISDTIEARITTGLIKAQSKDFDIYCFQNVVKSNSAQKLKIEVYDLSGRKVSETVFENNIKLDLNEGLYILRVFDNSGLLVQSRRIYVSD